MAYSSNRICFSFAQKPRIDEIDPNVKLPDWYDTACQADNVRSYIYKI